MGKKNTAEKYQDARRTRRINTRKPTRIEIEQAQMK